MKTLRLLLFLPPVIFALQAAYYAPKLPQQVASHFDAAGRPNGWSSRTSFFVTGAAIQILLLGIFAGLSFGIRKIPRSLVNLPRKDYWLAPERREETFAFMGRQLLWFALATQVFYIAIIGLCIRANLPAAVPAGGAPAEGQPFLLLMAVYLGFTLLWGVRFFVRFLRRA